MLEREARSFNLVRVTVRLTHPFRDVTERRIMKDALNEM